MERLTDKNHNAVNRCGEYSSCYSCNREKCYISELADKLAEFEDFIEEQGFEDLQDLERYIEQTIKASELLDKKMKENQALKDRWEALKKFIKIHFIKSNEACEISSLFSRDREILKMVLDKINDLESE